MSAKIPESLVIIEFIADLFPEARLLPATPLKRAETRLFINAFETRFFDAFKDVIFFGKSTSILLDAFAEMQARLPPAGFAVGEFSLADVAVVPVFLRVILLLENEIGKYPLGEGKKAAEALQEPKFARLAKYMKDVKARPSVTKTYDEVRAVTDV